jgi:hypothetical protein
VTGALNCWNFIAKSSTCALMPADAPAGARPSSASRTKPKIEASARWLLLTALAIAHST